MTINGSKKSGPVDSRGEMAKILSQTSNISYYFKLFLVAYSTYYIYSTQLKGDSITNANASKLQHSPYRIENTAPLPKKKTYQKHLHTFISPVQISTTRMPITLFSENKLPPYKNVNITKYIVQSAAITMQIE